MIVEVIAALVLLVAVNEAILPLPLAPRPIAVLLLVQLYDVPVPLNVTAVVDVLLHTLWFPTAVTVGVGFTVIVKVCAVPTQPLAVGVTVNIPLIALAPVFVAVNEAIELPVPLAAAPIEVLLFVHAYVGLVPELVNTSVLVLALLHTL